MTISIIPLILLILVIFLLVGFGTVTLITSLAGAFVLGPIKVYRSGEGTLAVVGGSSLGLFVLLIGLAVPVILIAMTVSGKLMFEAGDEAVAEAETPAEIEVAEESEPAESPDAESVEETSTGEESVEPTAEPTEVLTPTPAPITSVLIQAGIAQLREGPGYAFDVLLNANVDVEVGLYAVDETGNWFLVRSPVAEGWLPARDLDLEEVDTTSLAIADPLPEQPEADSIPRISAIDAPLTVPPDGAEPSFTFLDAETDVATVDMEPVFGTFETFTINVLGVEVIDFDLFECGDQLVTLSAIPVDQEGNVGPEVYFSFTCVP